MSFFKNLLGGLVKDVVENVKENVSDKETVTTYTTVEIPEAMNEPKATPIELVENEIPSNDIAGGEMYNSTTFGAEGDISYRVEMSYTLVPGFTEFDSSAAEVDVCYVYDSQDGSWDDQKPYIAVMFDNMAYKILKEYNTTGIVKQEHTLEKIKHDTIKYKSVYSRTDGVYMQYHFYRYNDGIDYHLQVFIPKKYVGTDMEIKMSDALDLMASTYKEEKIME